jgi:hypothetical protein
MAWMAVIGMGVTEDKIQISSKSYILRPGVPALRISALLTTSASAKIPSASAHQPISFVANMPYF